MIRLSQVHKVYPHTAGDVSALAEVSLEIPSGQFVALIGPSGSGKSTLLHLVGTLDAPTRGTVAVDGRDLASMKERDLLQLRREVIGFVFQDACLVPSLTVAANVRLAQTFSRRNSQGPAVSDLLERVGLGGRAAHYPNQLSGGEEQRAAIARGIANGPKVILADEPTGHLDSQTGDGIGRLFLELNQELGTTIILATHNEALARLAPRRIHLKDGRVVDDSGGGPGSG